MAKNNIIDISYFQGNPNFAQLATHCKAIILRVQDGGFFDPKYVSFAKQCKAHGIPFGVYSFCRYTDTSSAIAEARRFYARATTGGLSPNFYFLDVETAQTAKLASATEAYRQELIRLGGKKVGIYIAHHLRAQSSINFSKFDKVWIPRYSGRHGVIINPAFPCDLHQYTEHGRVAGIAGNVDMNRIMKGNDSWYVQGINGGGSTVKPSTTSKPKPSKDKKYYTMAPKVIVSKTNVNVYKDKAFKHKVTGYPKGTEFRNVKLVKYGKITRFRLNTKDELYITSNMDYVMSAYYGSKTKQIVTKKKIYIYESPEFNSKTRVRSYPKGTTFNIQGGGESKAGTLRLKTDSGHYITAHKDFVRKTK